MRHASVRKRLARLQSLVLVAVETPLNACPTCELPWDVKEDTIPRVIIPWNGSSPATTKCSTCLRWPIFCHLTEEDMKRIDEELDYLESRGASGIVAALREFTRDHEQD